MVDTVRKIKTGILWQFIETAVFFLLNFFLILIVTQYLDSKQYGIYTALLVYITIFSEFSDLGFKHLIVRDNSKRTEVIKCFNVILVCSIILFIIFELFVYYIGKDISDIFNDKSFAMLFGSLCLILPINNYLTSVYRKDLYFKSVSQIRIFSAILSFITVISFIYITKNLFSLLAGLFISEIFKTTIYLKRYRGKDFFIIFSYDEFKKCLKRSFGLYISHLLGFLSRNVDYMIVAFFLGPSDLGIYSLAYRLMGAPVKQIGGVVNKVMFPVYGKIELHEEIKAVFTYSFFSISLYATILFLVISSLSENLVTLLFSTSWNKTGYVLEIVSVAGVFLIQHNCTEPLLKVVASQSQLIYRQFFYVVSISLLLVVGSIFGLKGACYGLFIGLMLTVINSIILCFKILKLRNSFFITLIGFWFLGILFFGLNKYILWNYQYNNKILLIIIILLIDLIVFIFIIQILSIMSKDIRKKVFLFDFKKIMKLFIEKWQIIKIN